MNRIAFALTCALVASSAGCALYFEDEHRDGRVYCDTFGCYVCDRYGCDPIDGDLPPNGGSGTQGLPGDSCASDQDCVEGTRCGDDYHCRLSGCRMDLDCPDGTVCAGNGACTPDGSGSSSGGTSSGGTVSCNSHDECPATSYCDIAWGLCVESWSCSTDWDCYLGFYCDDRQTCTPEPCDTSADCQSGCYCDESLSECIETSTCASDNECSDDHFCDLDRQTCTPCEGGSCGCEIDGDCADGEVCNDEGVCVIPPPPTCPELTDELTCLNRSDCYPVYGGINCTKPGGGTCDAGDQDCVCEDYDFVVCVATETI